MRGDHDLCCVHADKTVRQKPLRWSIKKQIGDEVNKSLYGVIVATTP